MATHVAGALPVLSTPDRSDFLALFFALVCNNEPRHTNPSVNAHMISGLVNWERLRCFQGERIWSRVESGEATVTHEEFDRRSSKESSRYLDRILLICRSQPYSGVPGNVIGLEMSEREWIERSDPIRIEHELTHYATKRVFGIMRRNILDELLADFMGLSHVFGRFSGQWFLDLIGLRKTPHLHMRGRGTAYLEGLSKETTELVCRVVESAAFGVEDLWERRYTLAGRCRFFLALASMDLDLIASGKRDQFFSESWESAGRWLSPQHSAGPGYLCPRPASLDTKG
jgi:hypothetical protein